MPASSSASAASGSCRARVEPTIQSCSNSCVTNRFLTTNPYQIGLDILWEREF